MLFRHTCSHLTDFLSLQTNVVKRLVPAASIDVGSGCFPSTIDNRGGHELTSRIGLVVSLGKLSLRRDCRGSVGLVPGSRGSGLLTSGKKLLLLLLKLLNISVEEQIDRDFPGRGTVNGATHAENFASQQPVHKTDGKLGLVVARDGAIDVLKRRVRVAQANHGDANVRGLLDSLGIDARVSYDQQTRLLELLGLLVGESTGGEAAGNAGSTSELGELEDSTLAERTAGDTDHILRVFDGHNDTGSNHELLPGLAKVEDVKSIRAGLPDIRGHLGFGVVGSDVDTGGEHALHVLIPVEQKG